MANRIRLWLAVFLVIAVACSSPQVPSATTPVNPAVRSAARALCEDNGGSWHQTGSACTRTVGNARPIEVELSADYPADLLDDPTAGQPLRNFVTAFFTRFGKPDDELIHDGSAELRFETFEHAPDVESIVFTNV